jgi:hypothetical protein
MCTNVMFRCGGCSAVSCIHLPPDANAASRPSDYYYNYVGLLHDYWSKLLLIIRPVSIAAAATEKAAAAAAARRLKNEARDKAAAEARARSEAAAAAVDPELKAALAELQRKKADFEAAQTRVNALKDKKRRA